MKMNCLRYDLLTSLILRTLAVLSFSGWYICGTESPAFCQEKGPPPLLQGGIVKQLRTLTQDALSSLDNAVSKTTSAVPEVPNSNETGFRVRSPRANEGKTNFPPQPSGRTVLRRTNASPWLERFVSKRPEASRTDQEDSLANERAAAARRVPETASAESNGDQALAQVLTPEELLNQRRGVASPSSRTSQDQSVDNLIHVERELPVSVRSSLKSTQDNQKQELNRQRSSSSLVSTQTRQDHSKQENSPPTENQPPRVARIPLPSPGQKPTGQTSAGQTSSPGLQRKSGTRTNSSRPQESISSRSVAKDAVSENPLAENSAAGKPPLANEPSLRRPVTSQGVGVPTDLATRPEAERRPTDARQVALPSAEAPKIPSIESQSLPMPSMLSTRPPSQSAPAVENENRGLPSARNSVVSRPRSESSPTAALSVPRASTSAEGFSDLPIASQPAINNGLRSLDTASLPSSSSFRDPSQPRNSLPSSTRRADIESPRVQIFLNGPSDLAVGEFGSYEVVAQNVDLVDVQGLQLTLSLPAGVQIRPGEPQLGELETSKTADGGTTLMWSVDNLPGGQTVKTPVQISAQSARNFALAMEWKVKPLSATTNVRVRAARLELALEGPSQVIYGEANTYRLHLRNAGDAPAEQVAVTLTAEPYGDSSSEIGSIAAGGEETVDIELTFKKKGSIDISASVAALRGLSAETAIKVLVRKPELTAEIAAPQIVYYGTEAKYLVRLRNSGDATAKNMMAMLVLPEGAQPITLPQGATVDGRQISWELPGIEPNAVAEFPIVVSLLAAGDNLMQFACADNNGNEAVASASTRVEAVADLTLLVNDPVAPAPVGTEVAYELELANRGSKAAAGVEVVAQFSAGIEPIRGVGHACRIVPGQVFFEAIPSIAPGETVRLKIFAKAEADGMHRFRTEVRSSESDLRLVQEESTRFLQTDSRVALPPGSRVIR